MENAEKRKWDTYYASLEPVTEDECTATFNQELTACIGELVPRGARILEAGCGGGWQSLSLARNGGFDVTLLDFSTEAIAYAKHLYQREGVAASFIQGDIRKPLDSRYDVVFNAGVLEHYSFNEQVSLLKGMAAKTSRFVLVLVPNRDCYWYWTWRLRRSINDEWHWGTEIPMSSLQAAFRAAGIQFLGQRYLGSSWTEAFIRETTAEAPELRELLTTIHHDALVGDRHRGYLVAALGSVGEDVQAPPGWTQHELDELDSDRTAASLSDALAALTTRDRELRRLRESADRAAQQLGRLEQLATERDRARGDIDRMVTVVDALSSQVSLLQRERGDLLGSLQRAAQAHKESTSRLDLITGHIEVLNGRLESVLTSADQARNEVERLERHARELSIRLAEQEQRCTELEAKAEVARKAQDTLQQALDTAAVERQKALDEAAASASALGNARRRMRELESALEEKESHLSLEHSRADLAVRDQTALRSKMIAAGINFDAKLQEVTDGLRLQRAWRVMLAIRKAYTLWTQYGLAGKLRSLLVPWELVAKSSERLSAYDIRLPSIWDYLPDQQTTLSRPSAELAPPAKPGAFDVIVLPVFDFEFRFQRPQQIAVAFARAGHRVFWISPSRSASPDEPLGFQTVALRDNVYEVRLGGEAQSIYTSTLSPDRAAALGAAVQSLCREFGVSEAAVLVQFPFWRQLAQTLKESLQAPIVYDCMDDWRNWTAEPRISDFSLLEEQKLARECDVLAATSAELAGRLRTETGRDVLRVRNGVDFAFFQSPEAGSLLSSTPHPIIGYYGAIADWVDIDLMTELARRKPEYTFVIIGEVHGGDISGLQALPNVQLLGEKNYSLIPTYLQSFDVCLLPFRQNRLTKAVDPVKLYEYLSQGKPVIATPLPEVAEHGDLVYFGNTAAEFADLLEQALREPAELGDRRRAFAKDNSWASRTQKVKDAIVETFPLVSILAVSYNSREYLAPFLDSLRRNTGYPNYELILVDNASTDGSQEVLKDYAQRFPELRTVFSETNLGFAAGNNLAARNARGEYLVLLNVDTVLPKGWLGRLLRPLHMDPTIGVTAPVTNFSGNQTRIRCGYRTLVDMERLAQERAAVEFGKTLDLEMVPLLCAALSRRLWEETGGLDEAYGAGMFEDDDFCVRVRSVGYRIVTAEDCFIHHFGNGSFAKVPHADSLRLFEKNRAYFESKWARTWRQHAMREGVPPLTESCRISIEEFLNCEQPAAVSAPGPVLRKLHPDRTAPGEPVNLQPSGDSALVVECEHASPGTVIRFGRELLQTSYGHEHLLSAILPPDFNRVERAIPVSIVNELGESEPLLFRVAV